MEKTLPDFDLADLSGARWRLADFKGKATLVGIWATW
jgi:peroxiredoxin